MSSAVSDVNYTSIFWFALKGKGSTRPPEFQSDLHQRLFVTLIQTRVRKRLLCLRILVWYLFELCQVVLVFFLCLLSSLESERAEYYLLFVVYIDNVFTSEKDVCLHVLLNGIV